MKRIFRLLLLLPLTAALFVLLPRTAAAADAADAARLKQLLHDEIWKGAEKIEFSADDYGGISETAITQVCSLLYKEPDMFVLNPNSGFSITREVEAYTILPPYMPNLLPNYEKSKQAYTEILTELLSGVDQNWTKMEKILYCHDLICTRYRRNYITRAAGQEPGDQNTAFKMMTALTEDGAYRQEGTDMAYAMLFKAMLDALDLPGIQCSYASGTFKDEAVHNWNVVKLDDDLWYNVDVFEDDYHLLSTVGQTNIPGHASHSYFLVSTNYLMSHDRQAHYATDIAYVAEEVVCNSTLYEAYVWQYALSPFVRMNGVWYFLDDKTQSIRVWDGHRERTDEVISMQSIYTELNDPANTYLALTGMFGLGGRLYFTTTRYLMRCDPQTLEWEVLHDTMDDTANSNYQIRGCALQTDADGSMSMAYLLWLNNAAQHKTEPLDPYRSVENGHYGYYAEGGLLHLRLERLYPIMVAYFDEDDRMVRFKIQRNDTNTPLEVTLAQDGVRYRIFAVDVDSKPRCDVAEGTW